MASITDMNLIQCLDVTINNDDLSENDEDFSVTLNFTDSNITTSSSSVTVVILNDDGM